MSPTATNRAWPPAPRVVVFCGGRGTRLAPLTQQRPKPLVDLSGQPLLWHLMHSLALQGCREFILCLGYEGAQIRAWAEQLDEPWQITCLDTGLDTKIAGRLHAVAPLLGPHETVLAVYGDVLADVDLAAAQAQFAREGRLAQLTAVRPPLSMHLVEHGADGEVRALTELRASDLWVNGGFMLLTRAAIESIQPGDELVVETFARLIQRGELGVYRHAGFFGPMDTPQDRERLLSLLAAGAAPWLRLSSS